MTGGAGPRVDSFGRQRRVQMKPEVKAIHRAIGILGERLGFEATYEASGSVLALDLPDAYRPRADVLWSQPISAAMQAALDGVLHLDRPISNLPVAGFEVEGSGPSTKTMTSDVVNLVAIGTRLSFLVVSEAGEKNIYRRAVRVLRTMRRSFGDLGVVPLEAGWLDKTIELQLDPSPSQIHPMPARKPLGGESSGWTAAVRALLRRVGERAGFTVVEPHIPPVLEATFERQRELKSSEKWSDYFTASQIDMAWLLPMPRGLTELMFAIDQNDRSLDQYGLLYREAYDRVPVVGFEFESNPGKHAAGGLANLSAYTLMGVTVVGSERHRRTMEGALTRYRPTLGLRNVQVRMAEDFIARLGE